MELAKNFLGRNLKHLPTSFLIGLNPQATVTAVAHALPNLHR